MLADGLTENIITDLSQNGWLFVIARNSLSAYNGWQPPWITLGLALAALGDFKEARHAVKHGHRLATGVPRFGFQKFFHYIARDQEQGEEHSILIERVWNE